MFGDAHVIADISGWYASNTGFDALTPARLLDTRTGTGGVARTRIGSTAMPLTPLRFTVAGTHGVPGTGAGAVSLNVTVVEPTTDGYATVYPCGTLPNTSNVNFRAGITTANAVIAPLSAGGEFCIAVFGHAHVIADINGWYAS